MHLQSHDLSLPASVRRGPAERHGKKRTASCQGMHPTPPRLLRVQGFGVAGSFSAGETGLQGVTFQSLFLFFNAFRVRCFRKFSRVLNQQPETPARPNLNLVPHPKPSTVCSRRLDMGPALNRTLPTSPSSYTINQTLNRRLLHTNSTLRPNLNP